MGFGLRLQFQIVSFSLILGLRLLLQVLFILFSFSLLFGLQVPGCMFNVFFVSLLFGLQFPGCIFNLCSFSVLFLVVCWVPGPVKFCPGMWPPNAVSIYLSFSSLFELQGASSNSVLFLFFFIFFAPGRMYDFFSVSVLFLCFLGSKSQDACAISIIFIFFSFAFWVPGLT